jgi:hypothetical protein
MNILKLALRLTLGLIFVVFGLNGFLHFIKLPEHNVEATNFLTALAQTGYMFPWIKAMELISGLMLMTNICVPLALIFLAPITLNVLALHLFLDPSGLAVSIVVVAMNLILGILYFNHYKPLFKSN